MRTNGYYILYFFLCLMVFHPANARASEKKASFTVVIDAGHGGHDPGAIGRKGREKNINLNVALKVGKLIQTNCPDTRVVYTRSKDVFVPLHRRAEIANNAKADLFISIHTNSIASRSSNVSGTETYTLGLHRTQENLEVAKKENSVILIEDDYTQQYAGFNPNSSESYIIFEFLQDKNMAQSIRFAQMVQKQFRKERRPDKGVHQAGFLVLRETSMPSVLIELGYITNAEEERFLLSEHGASTLARSIYNAFISYKKSGLKGNAGIQSVPQKPAKPENPVKEPIQTASCPVFKIQILTSSKVLPKGSKQLKGLSPVSYYREKGLIKYTYGEDTDYNKIRRLKREKVDRKFADAFIIAFRDGEKMDIRQAIKEFKQNSKQK